MVIFLHQSNLENNKTCSESCSFCVQKGRGKVGPTPLGQLFGKGGDKWELSKLSFPF